MATTVYLNIGSNSGNRQAMADAAVAALGEAFPEAILRVSPPVVSAPWGYDSPNQFLNLGVALDFAEAPEPLAVLDKVQEIEQRLAPGSPHRNADGSYRDRSLDIDIIHIDNVVMETDRLTLPHPRAEARSFVMEPMQFLCPGWSPSRFKAQGSRLKKSIADMGRDSVEQFRAKPKLPLTLVLDNIRSLNNIGSMFRTADAFMLDGIALCGITAAPPDPQIHKTALGAEESVAWKHYPDTAAAVAELRAEGRLILCLEQVHGSVPLDRYEPEAAIPLALVVGNEVSGVDPAIVAAADGYLEIPQCGTKHSLNVAVSAAIAMWHIFSHLNPSENP